MSNIVATQEPEYDFMPTKVSTYPMGDKDKAIIQRIVDILIKKFLIYIADGHHRTAAAALVGENKKRK